MKSKLLILTLLLGCNLRSQAQSFFEKGWVVTTSGDTLKGFIAEQSHKQLVFEVIFKTKKNDDPRVFKPKEAKSFFIEPNQYFESHLVTINNPNGRKTNDAQYFLYRSEAGYLSVFSMPLKKLIFIKKQGDSVLYPLYMTITTKDENNNKRVDTLINENLDRYGSGRLGIKYDYIYTLSKFFNEGQSYQAATFPLEESRIIYEVKKYNNKIHPNILPQPIITKRKWKPTWSLAVNYLIPVNQKKYDSRLSFYNQIFSSTIQGYEFLVGLHGQNRTKGVSIELGFNKILDINSHYSYSNTGAGSPPQYFDGNYESVDINKVFRINYTTNISTKFSPYFSVILNSEKNKYTQSETERSTNSTRIISNEDCKSVETIIESVGCQYAFTKEHLIRAEFNFSFADLAFNRAVFKIGYQYRLWK
jgi:hypothetical protein